VAIGTNVLASDIKYEEKEIERNRKMRFRAVSAYNGTEFLLAI
jgi:hypothetical protein